MIRLSSAPLALAVTLVLAAGGSGDGDWALIIPAQERICAKSEQDCRVAMTAIWGGRWAIGLPRTSEAYCRPWPQCFPEDSNHIIKGER